MHKNILFSISKIELSYAMSLLVAFSYIIISQLCHMYFLLQCWKLPVARWPHAPNFCLGPPEIIKLWTLVAQIYVSGNSKLMDSSTSGYFEPLTFWTV